MTYDVIIEAIVRKTIRVEDAQSEQHATELAHELFTVVPDEDGEEKYEERTIDCSPIE